MSQIYWPATLPQRFNATGFDWAFQKNALATAMDKGVGKTRLRSFLNYQPINAVITVSQDGVMTVMRFFEVDTEFGTLDFKIEDQVADGAALLSSTGDEITTRDGTPLTINSSWDVAFSPENPPRVLNNRGLWYDVGFQLLRLP